MTTALLLSFYCGGMMAVIMGYFACGTVTVVYNGNEAPKWAHTPLLFVILLFWPILLPSSIISRAVRERSEEL